jgi:hypothetical protein
MLSLFKAKNANKPHIREFDPVTVQRIKESAYLVKMISETQVAARKCDFYAGNAIDLDVKMLLRMKQNYYGKVLRPYSNIMNL